MLCVKLNIQVSRKTLDRRCHRPIQVSQGLPWTDKKLPAFPRVKQKKWKHSFVIHDIKARLYLGQIYWHSMLMPCVFKQNAQGRPACCKNASVKNVVDVIPKEGLVGWALSDLFLYGNNNDKDIWRHVFAAHVSYAVFKQNAKVMTLGNGNSSMPQNTRADRLAPGHFYSLYSPILQVTVQVKNAWEAVLNVHSPLNIIL